MVNGSGGSFVMVFAEEIDAGLGISGADLETNLAKLETDIGKTIWSFDMI